MRRSRTQRTIGSLFSGGGGWDQGAIHAGLRPMFAVELQPWIAAHYASVFGPHVVNASVWDVDYARLPHVDVLVSSPPCQATSASGAQARAKRIAAGTPLDEGSVCDPTAGLATLKAVDGVRPDTVLIENNPAYAKTATFKRITQGLLSRGYSHMDARTVEASEYGIESGRQRLILRASTRPLPPWPAPMPRHGWYAMISDLIPSMPVDPLAPWQQRGMEANPPPRGVPLLIAGGNPGRNERGHIVWRTPSQPSWTIQLGSNTGGMRVIDRNGVPRKLVERGIARLMGFPDDYVLPAARRAAIHLIGNSVPPKLAYQLLAPFA